MAGTHPTDPIVDAFESHRDRLRAVAYRMLGSHADAEDVVQEAWLRLARQDTDTIDNLGGWLTTVVGRISLDVLRSGRTRPEVSFDDQLPQFTVTLDNAPAPQDLAAIGDSVGLALLIVLDSLRPDERLAFVLHDVFAVPFAEIGTPFSTNPPTRPKCSPAAPAGRYRPRSSRRAPDDTNARWSKPSWPRPATAGSSSCCRFSTPK